MGQESTRYPWSTPVRLKAVLASVGHGSVAKNFETLIINWDYHYVSLCSFLRIKHIHLNLFVYSFLQEETLDSLSSIWSRVKFNHDYQHQKYR
jgi:hypothetical protein